jgi:sec-independent protein translocase protein TatA
MDLFSVPHLLLILLVVMILFGAGRLPRVMGDFAKGIKAFKAGMREDEESVAPPVQQVAPPVVPSSAASERPREHA